MITVRELADMTAQEVAKGNGNKKVYLSQDDEGNGFHPLFFGFTTGKADLEALQQYSHGLEDEDLDNIVILG